RSLAEGSGVRGATNAVSASSRDHAHLRVENTRVWPAPATRGPESIPELCRGRDAPGSPYRIGGLRAGASGPSPLARRHPGCGSAVLLGPASGDSSVTFLPVVSRRKPREMFTSRAAAETLTLETPKCGPGLLQRLVRPQSS